MWIERRDFLRGDKRYDEKVKEGKKKWFRWDSEKGEGDDWRWYVGGSILWLDGRLEDYEGWEENGGSGEYGKGRY